MKIKTCEATPLQLDWLVAKCEGRKEPEVVNNFAVAWYTWQNTHYSTNWSQGGPIIERERLWIQPELGHEGTNGAWYCVATTPHDAYGPTPLIAAMRCFCVSKLGEEVEVPDEITNS